MAGSFRKTAIELASFLLFMLPFMGISIGLFMTGISYLLTMHGLWQLDIICVNPVWGTQTWINWFLGTGYENYSDYPFQCGLWRTTMGRAYDVYLSLPVVGWFLLLVSQCVIWISIIVLLRRWMKKKSDEYLKIFKERRD